MAYAFRTHYIENRGPQYDWANVLCSGCMAKRPGWQLHGGPDTVYGEYHRPFHSHQPDGWCAAPLSFWGLSPETCCSECSMSLAEDDRTTWGVRDRDRELRLAEAGVLWRETTTMGDHMIDGDRFWTRVSPDYLRQYPALLV